MSYTDIHLNDDGEEIKSRPVYYTIPDLAKEFNVRDSRIRYWYEKFIDFFEADRYARVKKFNQNDVEVFRIIYKLREQDDEGADKIKIYLEENIDKIKNPTLIVDESENNKLLINTLVKHAIEENLNNIKDSIVREVAATLNEVVSKTTEQYIEASKKIYSEVEDKINSIELKLNEVKEENSKRDVEISNLLKENLELRKKEVEQKEKSIWKRIFNK
ncbi:MerR family transcriptional regulator [Clostridium perfringens]|uniref:MerR family transcriptional regulator n=1 Tax=Clostridium perfringens TaxID=1502 RepID=UPI00096A76D9|nr:MerR family transcriptional regulator [Clostridium perfringens]